MAERRSEKRITPDPVALNPIESNLEGIDPNIAQAVDAIDVALSEPDEANVEIQEDGSAIVGPELQAPINSAFTANLVDLIDVTELSQIFMDLYAAVERDKGSRKEWEQTYIDGLKYLGMQFDEERSQPFEGATGVIHPLLGEAVTQFQAQAYKELLPSGGPVKTQVVGDYTSQREEQAQRVKEFMNYQLLHVMQEYDPNLDQLLFYLPLSGSAFKKIYYNETMGRAMAQFIASENLVVPYETTDLLGCSRITHIIKMTRNEVLKLQATGFLCGCTD